MNRLLRTALVAALTAGGLLAVSCEPQQIEMATRPPAERPAARPPGRAPTGLTALLVATGKKGFTTDLAYLAAGPHRLAGRDEKTSGSVRAARYVEKRLRQTAKRLGAGPTGMEIYVQQFPVVQPRTTECRLVVNGKSHQIHAVRPNVLQASVTPEQGLTGEAIYVGKGEVSEYRGRSAAGKIVVMDFDCQGRWLTAFAFGAKAVIFIGTPGRTASDQHVNVPANLPRFYVTAEQADRLELRQRSREVTIFAACKWEQLRAGNVIVVLRGTDPKFPKRRSKGKEQPEAIVLAAPLDSYGEVPALSPGARDAANCAALLQITEYLAVNRPRRDIIVCFFDAQAQCHMGAGKFYGALYRRMRTNIAQLSMKWSAIKIVRA